MANGAITRFDRWSLSDMAILRQQRECVAKPRAEQKKSAESVDSAQVYRFALSRDTQPLPSLTAAIGSPRAPPPERALLGVWGKGGYFNVKGVSIPVVVSAFPDEIDLCPRSWAERAYPKLIHYNKLDKGGHFAAVEQPQLLSEEVRAGFRSLRSNLAKAA